MYFPVIRSCSCCCVCVSSTRLVICRRDVAELLTAASVAHATGNGLLDGTPSHPVSAGARSTGTDDQSSSAAAAVASASTAALLSLCAEDARLADADAAKEAKRIAAELARARTAVRKLRAAIGAVQRATLPETEVPLGGAAGLWSWRGREEMRGRVNHYIGHRPVGRMIVKSHS
jgi:hypothetical protein